MNAFEAVLLAVVIIGALASLSRHLSPLRAAEETGRVGRSWFAHEQDLPLEQRPDPSARDLPIPIRPPRAL